MMEDVRPAAHAMNVLAHQGDGASSGGRISGTSYALGRGRNPFSSISSRALQELLDNDARDAKSVRGPMVCSRWASAERGLYGAARIFSSFTSVFTAPPIMRVQHGKEEIGTAKLVRRYARS